ncbi:hypothetical protein WA026_017159 [Henosepilachna vigintioctopunctata]|uniref:Uncharacterized protein n=1 Tax=Henosepilachna vigintioctopunctata TaxID=420089 RepID=A0AAW1UD89_9CUCU
MAIQTSLKSQDFRQSIQESRQKFLDKLCENSAETEENKPRKNEAIRRRSVSRKISSKVRKTSSTYRKSRTSNIQKTTINASSVAALASKFNEIIEKQNVPKAEVRLQKLVRRLSSFNNNSFKEMPQTNPSDTNENKEKKLRKPSIKKKPNLDEKYSKVQSAKKISNNSTIILENDKELRTTNHSNYNKNVEIPECIPENPAQKKPSSIGFVKAAIENFEKKTFKPIISKRSLSEVHQVPSTNILESESNRRRSCKPDLQIPKKTEVLSDIRKLNEYGAELREAKVSSISEPNLILTGNLKTPKQEAVLFNSTSTIGNLSSSTSKIHDIPALFSKKIAENKESLSKSEYFESRISEKLTKSENPSDDNEGIDSRKTVEAFNLHVGESCYSVTDIIKPTSLETEGIENDDQKKNSGNSQKNIKPNSSFLWNKSSYNLHQFNTVGVPYVSTIIRPTNNAKSIDRTALSKTLPKDFKDGILEENEKIYEELDTGDDYELFDLNDDYEEVEVVKDETERDYEYMHNTEENIYETLPLKKQNIPLPRRPSSKNSDSVSNGYESIYNSGPAKEQTDGNYESIYFQELSDKKDNLEKDTTESVISSDQKTNSLYGTASLISWNEGTIYNGSANSEVSFSDKSEWIDVSDDDEDGESKIVIVRDTAKNKKAGSWSQQCRQQWSKASKSSPNEGQ